MKRWLRNIFIKDAKRIYQIIPKGCESKWTWLLAKLHFGDPSIIFVCKKPLENCKTWFCKLNHGDWIEILKYRKDWIIIIFFFFFGEGVIRAHFDFIQVCPFVPSILLRCWSIAAISPVTGNPHAPFTPKWCKFQALPIFSTHKVK